MATTYGPYRAKVIDVHDGDTLHADVDLGFGRYLNAYNPVTGRPEWSLRVYGIDAPELGTAAGKTAAAYAQGLLPAGTAVTVTSHGIDKYGGRFDGSITLPDGRDFAAVMVDAGHAVRKAYR